MKYLNILPIAKAIEAEKGKRDPLQTSKVLSLIPDDLTGINLAPVYDLLEDGDVARQLLAKEKLWEPNAFSLNYNGPISQQGEPLPSNLQKWERLMVTYYSHAEASLGEGYAPQLLKAAAEGLMHLSRNGAGDFNDCAMADDIEAARAAVKLIYREMAVVTRMVEEVAANQAKYLREQLYSIENGSGVEVGL